MLEVNNKPSTDSIKERSKKERKERRQEERYGSRKNEWNHHRRKKKRKAFYTNAESVMQFCILHSVAYSPNVLSF